MSKNTWNNNIEKVLKNIENKCAIHSAKHDKISTDSEKIYSGLMISSIVISPLSGIVNSVGSMVTENIEVLFYFTMSATVLSFLTGILISITKFNKYDQMSHSHLVASSRYTSLENNIKRQLLLDREDRQNANDYLELKTNIGIT